MQKVANFLFSEILATVNSSENVIDSLKRLLETKSYVGAFLTELTNETWVDFDIDEIKYTEYGYHQSLAGAYLLSKSSWNVYKQILLNPAVKKHTKIFQCKSLLEMLDEGEAKIFKGILKKDLTSLYPNITYEIINIALFGVNE
jgi:hypothetical protein